VLLALSGSTITTALAIVGVASGLGALLFVGGLRAALEATKLAYKSIKEAFDEEVRGREADKARLELELGELRNRVEMLQSAWVTEVAVEIGHAVSTAFANASRPAARPAPRPRRPRGAADA
jgi:flavin-dependent dehydrogenase